MEDATNIALEAVGTFLQGSEAESVSGKSKREFFSSSSADRSSGFLCFQPKGLRGLLASPGESFYRGVIIYLTNDMTFYNAGVQCSESVAGFMNQCGNGMILSTVTDSKNTQRAFIDAKKSKPFGLGRV